MWINSRVLRDLYTVIFCSTDSTEWAYWDDEVFSMASLHASEIYHLSRGSLKSSKTQTYCAFSGRYWMSTLTEQGAQVQFPELFTLWAAVVLQKDFFSRLLLFRSHCIAAILIVNCFADFWDLQSRSLHLGGRDFLNFFLNRFWVVIIYSCGSLQFVISPVQCLISLLFSCFEFRLVNCARRCICDMIILIMLLLHIPFIGL